jgi:murein DD-endopeptidase MepM/ murein hydrolase activator NlpD
MGYVTPADVEVSADWQSHKNRNPPSPEPGTDYATAYGTSLRCADNGTITVVDHSNSGGEGRRCTIVLDDGREVSYIHLSRINAHVGMRVSRGELHVMISGASGNGQDWYYGPHVHVTLHEMPNMSYANSIDFERYVGEDPTIPPPIVEDEDMAKMKGMYYTRASDNVTVYVLFNEESGWYSEYTTGNPGGYNNPIAQNWETNSWPSVTESHAKAIKKSLTDTVNATSAYKTIGYVGVVFLFIIAAVGVASLFI